jgi:hypothetical protein
MDPGASDQVGRSYYLGAHFSTKDYLLASPLWDLVSDAVLVTWSLIYGKAKLGSSGGGAPPPAPSKAVP